MGPGQFSELYIRCQIENVILVGPISQMSKVRHREVKQLGQDCSTNKGQSQGSHPAREVPESVFLTTHLCHLYHLPSVGCNSWFWEAFNYLIHFLFLFFCLVLHYGRAQEYCFVIIINCQLEQGYLFLLCQEQPCHAGLSVTVINKVCISQAR